MVCLSCVMCALFPANVEIIFCGAFFCHLLVLVVVAEPSIEGPVTTGEEFRLSCQLDSGEDAPSVNWTLVDMGCLAWLRDIKHKMCM